MLCRCEERELSEVNIVIGYRNGRDTVCQGAQYWPQTGKVVVTPVGDDYAQDILAIKMRIPLLLPPKKRSNQ
jgi:hypothetical protein